MAGQLLHEQPIDEVKWDGEATGLAAVIVEASLTKPTFRCALGKGELYRAYLEYKGRLYCVLTYYIGGSMVRGRIVAMRGDT